MALQEQAKALEEAEQQEREQSFKVREYLEIMLSKSNVVSWAVRMVLSVCHTFLMHHYSIANFFNSRCSNILFHGVRSKLRGLVTGYYFFRS